MHTEKSSIIADFHKLYYESAASTWRNTRWLGVRVSKCPLDLWIYQEIIHEIRPDLIIETGTYRGGSALFLASMCDMLNHGLVVTVEITEQHGLLEHPRITYLQGGSTSTEVLAALRERVAESENVMVILDSNHSRRHVLSELTLYSPFVTLGSYLIVEDTHVNGHPILSDFGPGPWEATEEFLAQNPCFSTDVAREKFMFTFNPRGYLKRVREA